MRTLLAVFIAYMTLGVASSQAAAPVGGGKVFSGPEGERVSIITLVPEEKNQALLLVEGTGTELDGKVLPHTVDSSDRWVYYATERRGRQYNTVAVQDHGGRRSHHLHIPGRRGSVELKYDEARTQALKPEEVYALHRKQQADGTLSRLMAFDRKAEQAGQDEQLAEVVKATNTACGTALTAQVGWDGVTDEQLKQLSISSFCGAPLEALARLCRMEEGRGAIAAQVKRVECRFGAELKLEAREGRVAWTTSREAANQTEFATTWFEQNLKSATDATESLAQALQWEKTAVCTDGKGHYVAALPEELKGAALAYGDGSRFVKVLPPPFGLSGYQFLEPRFFAKDFNPSFRGHDMRVYSEVEVDVEKRACAVRCGEKRVPFTLLEREKARDMLRKAQFEPNPQQYTPYALLRDTQGRYYLVDRGLQPGQEKSFRVFIGPKGALQQQQMVDLVSDSEGEIFSTKKGELRLLVERQATSLWLEKGKRTELKSVPVFENLPLIYNELGVYTLVRLGTPCDDQ